MDTKITKNIRTRFAPSPTGYLHVGGLRTALYCYLFAKKHQGKFILRIEDTDQSREVAGATQVIIDNLTWAGINFDEGPGTGGDYGPYIQSQRLELYKKHALQLVDEGNAYYCFCSAERLEQVRQQNIAAHMPPAYDRHCRDLGKDEVEKRLADGQPHVIRMKVPLTGQMTFNDIIHGSVTIPYKVVDDQVLIKSDGFPTYHLALVVDDHYMEISHAFRGEEWLPSTPKHLLLYQYFGWQAPEFAHFPLLLNSDRSKLSKRQGDVAVGDYQNKGFLPEALVNFIALLGWNPGDTREIFSLDELVQEFSLERVGKAGAVFNLEKLQWLNQQYIMKTPSEKLAALVKPLFAKQGVTAVSEGYLMKVVELMKDRAVVLPDFVTLTAFFFSAPTAFDAEAQKKCWSAETAQRVEVLAKRYADLAIFDAASLESTLRGYAQELGVGAGKLLMPVRLAVTGEGHGPSLFHTMEIIGKEETVKRLVFAVEHIGL